ncbi:hypothetical protein EJB05_28753 [Eragrostis curvula]|uniref:Uncharacterized protein n=1 Tax=Eragrostis curvula TaxID=38414 RepID=A0A5J9URK9_9POAL|nr:hypothetical protein EJB05_28753 [Eragrostis curvula]
MFSAAPPPESISSPIPPSRRPPCFPYAASFPTAPVPHVHGIPPRIRPRPPRRPWPRHQRRPQQNFFRRRLPLLRCVLRPAAPPSDASSTVLDSGLRTSRQGLPRQLPCSRGDSVRPPPRQIYSMSMPEAILYLWMGIR